MRVFVVKQLLKYCGMILSYILTGSNMFNFRAVQIIIVCTIWFGQVSTLTSVFPPKPAKLKMMDSFQKVIAKKSDKNQQICSIK